MLIDDQIEAHNRIASSIALQQLRDVTVLATCSVSEFETRRNVIKQITHSRGRTMRARLTSALHNLATAPREPERGLLFIQRFRLDGTAEQGQFGDGSDAGQCLAAKTECVQMIEVFHASKLAGRMPTRDSLHLLLKNAATIVGNAHQAHAAPAHLNANIVRTRVQRILHQFFDNRGRSLNHLTSSNALSHLWCKRLNGGALYS